MKRLIAVPVIAIIAIFSYPFLSFADHIIHLKSGHQFITDRYWEEGGEIKFHFKNGVLGVPKATVTSIEEFSSDAPTSDEVPPAEAPDEKGAEVKKEGNQKPGKKIEEKKPLDEYYKKMKALKTQLNDSLKRLREATRNKDKTAKKRARDDMRKISKEIYELTDEVKAANNGELPPDWWKD
ncbi:MAG: hypothetical protein JRJ09_05635 [Deltaproteobacteria bacterium]|nr:hypothetical protein [Deltaproteobacteria bacterium]MBW2047997.1 hypothetical protein [Deltaproteobacteria bacterium]MBW2111388.1 hypothetical protein [Deltaproteobacteria bacterium]MBW2353953.1 hypothetical protein [Deltaproteobacteria bacterium]